MWFSEEVVPRFDRLSDPILVDPWSNLEGDLFKKGRLDCVYNWEEICPTTISCPYIEISIYHIILFMF